MLWIDMNHNFKAFVSFTQVGSIWDANFIVSAIVKYSNSFLSVEHNIIYLYVHFNIYIVFIYLIYS